MLNSKFKIQNSKFGFTMIELLIVIAVLGVLAVAVLSAINPIEQINRGRDTGSRSDSEQLLSAIDRYYTTQELYPWQVLGTEEIQGLQSVNLEWTDGTTPVLTKLSTGGTAELKGGFVTRVDALTPINQIKVHYGAPAVPGEQSSVYVCFQARSGSFKTEALTRCGGPGVCTGLPADLADTTDCETTICSTTIPNICLP